VLEGPVEPGADQPAEERGEDDLVGPLLRLAELAQPTGDDRAGGQEAEGEHQPERLDGQAEEVDLGLHRAAG
jgi:hypothetical protein